MTASSTLDPRVTTSPKPAADPGLDPITSSALSVASIGMVADSGPNFGADRLANSRLRDFNNTMKPENGPKNKGIIGNMSVNGLRDDNKWMSLVSSETEAQVLSLLRQGSDALNASSYGQDLDLDLSNPRIRNAFINKLQDLHGRGTFSNLSAEDQACILKAAKKLDEVGQLISSKKTKPQIQASGMQTISVESFRQIPEGYVSPTGQALADAAKSSSLWERSRGKGYCQREVADLISQTLKTKKVSNHAYLVVNTKVYERGYGYYKVVGATYEDLKKAPPGSVAIYDDPNTRGYKKSHAQLKVDNSKKGWISDFRHDDYVYGDTPPKSLVFHLYIPKDYVGYTSRMA